MNKEQDYASDTDESDEEFRPDAAGESAVSEEESNGSENEEEHEGGDEATKQNVRKSKKLTKKVSRKKKSKNKDDDSDDEDTTENDDSQPRRSTRQTDVSLSNGRGKPLEKDRLDSDEEDKSRTNALWADFLNDVAPVAAASTTKPKITTQQTQMASSSSNGKVQSKEAVADKAQTSLQPNKASTVGEPKKVTVVEVLDFAGEEVRIQKEIDASSIKENKAIATAAPKMQPFGRIMPGAGIKRPAGSGSSGLGSLLNQIGKKKKISVLEKSQMDWKSFKTDEGIDEQLQTYNKGKDGYLERQDFLQRTDLRQFEIEKNLRQTSRRPL